MTTVYSILLLCYEDIDVLQFSVNLAQLDLVWDFEGRHMSGGC